MLSTAAGRNEPGRQITIHACRNYDGLKTEASRRSGSTAVAIRNDAGTAGHPHTFWCYDDRNTGAAWVTRNLKN